MIDTQEIIDAQKITALTASAWELRSQDPQQALALSREAVCLARKGEDAALLAAALCLQGICLSVLSQQEEARAALKECLPLSRRAGDLATEARCLHYLGVVHWCLAEHTEAVEDVTASLQIREELKDWEGVGAGFNVLGNIQFNLCDYGQALDWYVRGLEARERAGDSVGAVGSLCNIGNIYAEQGEHQEALRYHQRGLAQADHLGNPALQLISLGAVGSDYVDLGRYDEGIEICRRAVSLGKTLENWGQAAAALTSLAYAHNKTGRRREALQTYAEALEIAAGVPEQKVAAHALYSIGDILADSGELDQARVRLTEAAALAQTIGARRTAFLAFQALAEVCKRQGDYAVALGYFEAFRHLEKEVFTEEADERAKSLVIKMEVQHHRREAETLAEINAALQAANARLESLATTDPLTGLPNHRALVSALDSGITRAHFAGEPFALLFLDIDHFKHINDAHGHPAGDVILREFSSCVRSCLREGDTLGRWGGEEFLILLPGTDLAGALQIGERVRAAVAACRVTGDATALEGSVTMTCSLGAAACPPAEPTRNALIHAADNALYAAKRLGRNQVRGTDDPARLSLDGLPAAERSNSSSNPPCAEVKLTAPADVRYTQAQEAHSQ